MSSINHALILACFTLLAAVGPGPAAPAQERDEGEPAGRQGDGVYNIIEGQTTILSLKPEGSYVKKGEVVCELDPAVVRDKLARQVIATKGAEQPYQNARRAREVAEIAVREYVEGIYKQERERLDGAIALGEAERKRTEERYNTVKRLFEQGKIPEANVTSAHIDMLRAKLSLEQAQTKKDVLEKYTKKKTVMKLQSEVERARSEELVRQAVYGREKAIQEQLEKQIESCKVVAPASGRLHYSPPIEEGADVGKGQLLFRVIPEEEPKEGARSEPQP